VHLVLVEVFEQISFLSLVVGHVEGVARHVLMLAVKVFDNRQGVIVGTLLERSCVGHLAGAKAVLVLDLLTQRVLRRRLDHSVRIRLHNLLSAALLSGHRLPVALVDVRCRGLVVLTIERRPHAVLLPSSQHISGVVKIIGCEG